MKIKIIGVSLIIAMAFAAGWSFSQSKNKVELSDLTLANVEALARGESSGGQRFICYNKLTGLQGSPMQDKMWCSECRARPASKWSELSECTK